MADVLLIGYGNPLRGDDGIGWVVAEKMMERVTAVSVQTITQHQLLPEHAEPISQAKLVIFVDAAVGETPGTIQCEPVQPIPPQPGAFTHHLTPAGLLSLAQDVFERCPPAYLFTIIGAEFEFSEEISPLLQQKLPELLEKIEDVIPK
jgi:hydrogenase maturation protease